MKLEEVLPAYRAGKKIRLSSIDVDDDVLEQLSAGQLLGDEWSIVEEPATDEELAAAFEARAECWREPVPNVASELRKCADMVRKRYVDPSWRPSAGARPSGGSG